MRDLTCGAETRLTDGERAYYARYSPDGATIYYARIEEGDCSTALCAVDLGTGSRRIVRSFGDCNGSIHSFSISPDGNYIALALWQSGRQDIYVLSADGATLRQLTADSAQDSDPTWTPDGQHILFSSDPDRIYNIYTVDIGSGEIRKVTNLISGAFFPAVSPDGQTLAFVGYTALGYDLFSTALDLASAPLAPRRSDTSPAGTDADADAVAPPATLTAAEPRPYNPAKHLLPRMWLPDVSLDSAGIVVVGSEPVANTTYIGSVGWNFKESSPVYRLSVEPSANWRFPVAAAVAGGQTWSTQSITLTVPTWGKLPRRGGLTLGYEHTSRAGQSWHSLAASGAMGVVWARDLMRSTSSLQADSVIKIGPGMHWNDSNLEPAFSITAANATRLPIVRDNLLSLRASAGWSGSADPTRWPKVGGSEGRFRVRGVDDGYMTGSHCLRQC